MSQTKFNTNLKKVSPVSEADLIANVKPVNIRSALAPFKRMVARGKMRRYIVEGMPFYELVGV
jgi:hypothetical protein